MAPAIPKDSIVLVTGVNGYIGSHIADQLMEAGYRVRGTTRSVAKVQDLAALWDQKFGQGRFEVVTVEDMSHDGAFDEALKGVSGVAHVASNLTFDADPNKVIPEVLAGINGILKSAAKESSVKRFVYTSSSTAATKPAPEKEFLIDEKSWNLADIEAAHKPPPYNDDRKWAVYGASKAEGEQALWKFVKEQNPGFVANAVLPNCNFGKVLVKGQPASTGQWTIELFKGNKAPLENFEPQWFVNVQDTARLHVAALINPDLQNERIFAFAEPFNTNDLLKHLRKIRPDHKFPEDFSDNRRDRMKLDNSKGAEILKGFGRPGWTGLEESLKDNIQDL